MHMADALVSPAVGGGLWIAAAATLTLASRDVRKSLDTTRVPLMAVLGAFVFAAQMINFTIPGTGSSGHLVGGLLLAILLGPGAGFVTVASVLVVQALFFADGGLLALGCNMVNMGVFACFVACPVYGLLAGTAPGRGRVIFASVVAAVLGLELGAAAVALETTASGISSLPLSAFLALMLPIHLPIGVVEGLVTAAIILLVREARPDMLPGGLAPAEGSWSLKAVVAAFAVAALLTGGVVSWFASEHPDGLEWSLAGVTGAESLPEPDTAAHRSLARVQERTAFMPDYAAPVADTDGAGEAGAQGASLVNPETSLAGLVGALLTLLLAGGAAWLLRRRAPQGHGPDGPDSARY